MIRVATLKKSEGGSWFKYVLAGVLAIGLLSAGATVATQALFTSTASVGANTFTAGTVNIATTPASTLVTLTAMAPGDEVYGEIHVDNGGSLELRYALTSTVGSGENTMAAQLDLTIRGPAAASGGCTAAGFGTFGTGVMYGPADVGSEAGLNVIGDPTSGADAGDRVLADVDDEYLCFKVALPLSTGNSVQGATATATFDFISEQTANN